MALAITAGLAAAMYDHDARPYHRDHLYHNELSGHAHDESH